MKNISFRCQPTADVGDLLTINPSLMTHFTNWGRSVLCLLSVCWLSNADLNAQVSLSASAGTASGSYTTLSAAFTAINAGTHQGAITISLTADVTEVATATLNNSGHISGAVYTSVSITPSGARTISGTVAGAPLIDLNGCDVVTIDGLNTGGNALVISNLSTAATANTSTIRFMIDATNNILRNCSILGSATVPLATTGGTIYFATGLTTGNDNNTISTCNIGPAGANLPSKAIYGQGSTTSAAICNSGISITNCNIYDFFLAGGCAGVYAATGNTEWSMTNNKVYQTAGRAMTSIMYGFYFSNSTYGSGITITGNTLGYASSAGTGTLTLSGGGAGSFYGIYLSALSTATLACNLNNNVISDLSITTTGSTYGIYNITGASSNTINFNGNTIRNIATTSTATGSIFALAWGSATTLSVSNNTINNISRSAASTTYGLYSGSGSTNEVVNNNVISNITNSVTTGTVTFYGIYQNTLGGTKEFKNNSVFNFSTASTGTVTFYGIRVGYGTTIDISNNVVYGFSGPVTTTYGIYGAGTTTGAVYNVYKNKLYDLSSTSASATIYGIYTVSQTYNVYNNIIGDLRTPAANVGIAIAGIYPTGGTANNLYNNTVYLNATSSGALFGTTAVYAGSTTPLRMNNNLLVNNSTSMGATGFTTAFRRSGAYNATYYDAASNNNAFYAGTPGVNNLIFYDGTASSQTLTAYKALVTPLEVSAVTINPTWTSTTGSATNYLHIPASATPSVLESGGATISLFTTDYDGDARPGPVGSVNGGGTSYDIGADEFDGAPAAPSITGVSSTLPTTQCTAVARTVTATVKPVNPLTAVTLYYTTNGANPRSVAMTGGDPGVLSPWTAIIPVASPTNATIAWYVTATDGTLISQKVGTAYTDEPLLGVTATASATPATVCAGSPSSVTVNFSKPGIATIGAGGTTSSSSAASPFAGLYGGAKNQFIIKASELTAAGMGAGAFNSLAINCTASTEAYPLFNVAIGSTALNVMTSSFVGGLTDVYSSASYTPTVGVNTFTFNTPYVWDGVSNIIVSFCWNNGTATSTGSTVKIDAVSFVSSFGWRVDNQVGATMCAVTGTPAGGTSTTSSNRPQFLINGNLIPVMTGFAWSTSAGAAGTTQTITPNVNTNTTYNVIATGPANCTIAASTAVATLALPATPTGTSTAQCGTRVPSCSVTSTTGAATPIFRWYKASTGGTPLAGESGATLSAYSIASNDTFYVAEFNGTCESARRQLTVAVSTPELLTLSTPTTTCNNGTVALQVTSSLGNFDTYRWSPATNLFTNPACTNAYVAGTSATQVYAKSPVAGAAVYTCNSANVGCTNSQSTTVNVLPTSVIASAVGSSQFCTSGAATIRIAATPVGAGLQWQESPDGGGWADVVSATAASYTTPTLTQTNYYRLALKKSNGTECAYSNTLTVTISTPSVGVSEHGTKCGPGAVTLNVSGNNGDINWFTAATGGTAIATGNRYIPTLNAVGTTPFYAEASIIAGSYTGLGNGTATVPATTGASAERGIVFTASKNFTLVSAQYYSPTLSVTNSVVVRLLNDADGAVLNTVTLPIVQGATADWYTMNLNFEVTAGRTYRLLASFGQSVNRVSTGVDYTNVAFNNLGALGVINGGYDSGLSATTYSYFHNITAMEICKSPRQVVNATVTAPPALTLSNATTTICAGTPTSAVTVSSTLSDFATYTWSPAAGVTGTTSPVFNPSATTTYTLSAAQTSGNFCQNNASVTVTVNPLPSTPIITPATAVLCTGDGAVQLAAGAPGIVQKIGTPGTSNALTVYPGPYNNFYGGAKHQMLFTAAELTAAGLSGGSSVSAIKVTVTGIGTTFTGSVQSFHLKVGHTALTTLGTTFETGLTEVVAPSTVPITVGDIQHTFSTPFVWNGTSNLILETSYSNANSGLSTDGVQTEFSTVAFNGCNYYRADSQTPAVIAAATSATTSTSRPNITFVTLPVNCNWQALTTGLYTDAAATTPYVSGTVASVYAKPSATTTYTATAVSNAGCTSTATRMVTVAARPVPAIANSRPTTFCTGDSTVLTASGTGAYLWSTGATSAAITVTTAGVYKVKVTNAAGCADSTMVTVTVNARPTAAIANSRPTTFCAGDSTVLTASGAGTYRWSTGATTADVTAKVSGTYKVVVTNASGCADSAMIVVTANSRLAPVIANSRPTTFCVGDSTVLTASASGAATYAWSTGATTAAVTARTAGTYKVTVTSAAGCVDSTMASITVNTRPTAGVTNNRPTTFCAGDSTILTASGGGTYVWSTGATTTAVTARTTGTYKVTVTNASGCVDSTMIAVTTNARPVAAIAGATAICAGDSTIFTASGGGTYAWSNAATTAGITVKAAGTYKVVVTNASGCVDSTTRTLVVNARPTAGLSVSGVATFCQGDSTKLTATGGATYRWTTPSGTLTTNPITAKVSGVYKALVFNAAGCTDSVDITITVNPKPTVAFTSTSLGGSATFTNTSTGGNTYSWSFGDTTLLATTMNTTRTYRANGTYTVKLVVTSAAGCRDSITNTIVITRVANEEVLAGLKALVYPNPTARNLHIEFQTTTIQFGVADYISVTDAFGREVHRQAIGGTSVELNTENWASGLYMINAVISNQKIGLSKVVKIDK
jgi:trimeric autotransporter adhesin